jgi:hypothetical protein
LWHPQLKLCSALSYVSGCLRQTCWWWSFTLVSTNNQSAQCRSDCTCRECWTCLKSSIRDKETGDHCRWYARNWTPVTILVASYYTDSLTTQLTKNALIKPVVLKIHNWYTHICDVLPSVPL